MTFPFPALSLEDEAGPEAVTLLNVTPARPPAPASNKVDAWILTPPGKLTAEQHATLGAITARCPELAATSTLVRQFADMLTHRQGTKLPGWAERAEACDVQELRGFAAGLRKDWAAVTAGLPCPGAQAPSKATSTASR
jgi:transposase